MENKLLSEAQLTELQELDFASVASLLKDIRRLGYYLAGLLAIQKNRYQEPTRPPPAECQEEESVVSGAVHGAAQLGLCRRCQQRHGGNQILGEVASEGSRQNTRRAIGTQPRRPHEQSEEQ